MRRNQKRSIAARFTARLIAALTFVGIRHTAVARDFDPALVARAKAEGRLTLYSTFSGNQLHAAIKKGYEDLFGIPVDMLMARSSEVYERVRVEVAAGRSSGDVMLQGEASTQRMASDGLVQTTNGFTGAARLAVGDPAYRIAAPAFINGYGLMVNANLVRSEDEPKSWLDLLDAKWTGKMLADDMRALGSGGMFFAVTVEKLGIDYQKKLAAQKLVFGRDIGADQLRVARGEFPLRFPQSLSNMRDLKGLPLRFAIPKEGLPYIRIDAAIIKGSTRPNAAHLFAEYMLAPQTQNMLAGFGLVPVIKGAVNAPDRETSELVSRARDNLMGTFRPDIQEAMLALAKETYK